MKLSVRSATTPETAAVYFAIAKMRTDCQTKRKLEMEQQKSFKVWSFKLTIERDDR